MTATDLTGQRFGRLTALHPVTLMRGGVAKKAWRWACDCGAVKDISHYNVRAGTTVSCGCLARELVLLRNEARHHAAQARRPTPPPAEPAPAANPIPPGLAHLPRRQVAERHPSGRSFTAAHLPARGICSLDL